MEALLSGLHDMVTRETAGIYVVSLHRTKYLHINTTSTENVPLYLPFYSLNGIIAVSYKIHYAGMRVSTKISANEILKIEIIAEQQTG